MITGGGALLIGLENVDPGRDRHAGASRRAPALLGGARLGAVPRELRRAAAGPEHLAHRTDRARRARVVEPWPSTGRIAVVGDHAGPPRHHVARPDHPRPAGHRRGRPPLRTAAQDVVVAAPGRSPTDAIKPGRPTSSTASGAPTSSRPRTSSCAGSSRRRRARSPRARPRSPTREALKDLARPPRHRRLRRRRRARWSTARAGNFERTFQIDQGHRRRASRWTCRSSSARTAARSSARSRRSRSHASTVQRIDDAQFGVGVQLVRPDADRPEGHRARAARQHAARLSQIGSARRRSVDEGRARDHAAAPVSRRSRPGSRWAPSCATSTPATATASTRRCDPVVDLDCAHHRQGAPLPAGADPVIRRLRLGFVVIICVVLQTTLFTHLRIDGVAPDIGLVAVLAVAYEDGPDTGAWFGFVMGLADRPLPHHAARALGARRSRSPATRSACSRAGMVRTTPGSRRSSAAIGGLFGGLVFITVGALVGQSGFLSLRQPEDRDHRRDLRRADRPVVFPLVRRAARTARTTPPWRVGR